MRDEVCDFCGGTAPAWNYPIASVAFIRTTPDGTSVTRRYKGGHWSACDLCSTLIEHDDYDALARQVLVVQLVRPPGRLKAQALATVKAHHAHFRANRAGPRSAVSTGARESRPATRRPRSRSSRTSSDVSAGTVPTRPRYSGETVWGSATGFMHGCRSTRAIRLASRHSSRRRFIATSSPGPLSK
jgi:hypothetical protein